LDSFQGRFKAWRGLELYYRGFLPEVEPAGVVLINHGLGEHCGRYEYVIGHLLTHGYGVYAFDMRGHGRSEGLPGYVDRFSDYVADLDIFSKMVRSRHDGKAIFLLGHSVGGAVAASFAATYQPPLSGLVLSSPFIKTGASISRADAMMARLLSVLAPTLGIDSLDTSTLSRDSSVVEAYRNDPLVYHGKVRARLGAELINAMERDIPRIWQRINAPLLVMYATEDRLADPRGAQDLFNNAGSKDKTLKSYPGLYHEIFNEPERGQVLSDLADWLSAQI
jgi:acylglycerol lipase